MEQEAMGKELTGYRGSGTGLENREKRLGILLLIVQISTHSFFFFFLMTPSFNLEKAMATHPSTLAWKIPWMEEPGRLQSMGSQRVVHD